MAEPPLLSCMVWTQPRSHCRASFRVPRSFVSGASCLPSGRLGYSGRLIRDSNGDVAEIWSPNSTQKPAYSGTDSSRTSNEPTADYFDGSLGVCDYTRSPQLMHPKLIWRGFILRSGPTIEFAEAYACWHPDPSDNRVGRLSWSFYQRIQERNSLLDQDMAGLALSISHVYWSCRPIRPTVADMAKWPYVTTLEDHIDFHAFVCRGIKEKCAFLRTMDLLRRTPMSTKASSAPILSKAEERYIGFYGNSATTPELCWSYGHNVPVHFFHFYGKISIPPSLPVYDDFLAGSDQEPLVGSAGNFWQKQAYASKAQIIPVPLTALTLGPIQGLRNLFSSSQAAGIAFGHGAALLPSILPLQSSLPSHKHSLEGGTAKTPAAPDLERSPEDIRDGNFWRVRSRKVIASDRVAWVVPPPIEEGKKVFFRFEVIPGEDACNVYYPDEEGERDPFVFRLVGRKSAPEGEHWYDRRHGYKLTFPDGVPTLPGVVSDDKFGRPCPYRQLWAEQNGKWKKMGSASPEGMYATAMAHTSDVLVEAPAPSDSLLPALATPSAPQSRRAILPESPHRFTELNAAFTSQAVAPNHSLSSPAEPVAAPHSPQIAPSESLHHPSDAMNVFSELAGQGSIIEAASLVADRLLLNSSEPGSGSSSDDAAIASNASQFSTEDITETRLEDPFIDSDDEYAAFLGNLHSQVSLEDMEADEDAVSLGDDDFEDQDRDNEASQPLTSTILHESKENTLEMDIMTGESTAFSSVRDDDAMLVDQDKSSAPSSVLMEELESTHSHNTASNLDVGMLTNPPKELRERKQGRNKIRAGTHGEKDRTLETTAAAIARAAARRRRYYRY